VEKCGNAFEGQKAAYSAAVAALQLPNVALYLDGAQGGWTGWPGNIEKTAAVIGEIVADARKINPAAKIRGLATDVS
jgi:cellulose 1,4-beta-cellobiosidase